MIRLPALFTVALLALASCVGSPPTLEEIQAAEFGSPPTNPEPSIRAHFDETLKDPESARYEFSEPVKGWWGKTLSNLAGPRKINFGWLVRTEVNAKNSYGGYTGKKLYHCWFQGETLVWVLNPAHLNRQVEGSRRLAGMAVD